MNLLRHKRSRGFTLIEVLVAVVIGAVVFTGLLRTMSAVHLSRAQDSQTYAITTYMNSRVALFQSGALYGAREPGDGRGTTTLTLHNVAIGGGWILVSIEDAVADSGDRLTLTEAITFELIGGGSMTTRLTGIRY